MAEPKAKKSGGSPLPVALVVITLLAAGGGAGLGFILAKPNSGEPAAAAAAAPPKPEAAPPSTDHAANSHSAKDDHGGGSHGQAKPSKPAPASVAAVMKLRELPAITTNLNGVKAPWIRLEGSLVYDAAIEKDIAVLSTQIAEDFITYLRSVRLSQIEGGGGVQSLVEDLNERARIRSNGKVQQFIISGYILE